MNVSSAATAVSASVASTALKLNLSDTANLFINGNSSNPSKVGSTWGNMLIGYGAKCTSVSDTESDANISIGFNSGSDLGGSNTTPALGRSNFNLAVGINAYAQGLGARNVCLGDGAGFYIDGDNNVAIGSDAMNVILQNARLKATGCIAIGSSSFTPSNAPSTQFESCITLGSVTPTGTKQVQLGASGTTVYGASAYNSRSDARDKADITNLTYNAVEFIKALKPRNFKFDYRADYDEILKDISAAEFVEKYQGKDNIEYVQKVDGTYTVIIHNQKDGTKKRKRSHNGFIAQEVKEAADSLEFDFAGYQDHSVNGGEEVLTLAYEEFIAPIVSTMQAMLDEISTLKSEIKALKEVNKNE